MSSESSTSADRESRAARRGSTARTGERLRVAVCVATFRRPVWLRRTLLSLHDLDMEGTDAEVVVVVVDNDARGSAAEVVRELEARIKWPILYVVEPRPGITYARNAALRAADAVDLVAFLDDDEEATPRWLRELVFLHRSSGAPVVTGPVVPLFEEEPPSWITRGRFFERPRRPSGTLVEHAGTGNLLLRRTLLSELGEQPFDEAMALSGGEDTLLTMKLRRAGHAILWCDEAVVQEWVPSSRATASWLIRRAFRGGTAYALSESIVHRSGRLRVLRVVKGVARCIQGAGRVILGALTLRLDRIVAGAQTTALGVGMVMGVAGLRYEEYKRTAD